MQIQNPFITKLWHIIIFIFYIVSSFILFSWGYDIVHYFPILNSLCPQETCNVILVYRLAAAISIFHLVLAIILYGLNSDESDRAKLQNASWQLKIPFLIILLIVCAFIPERILIVFGWFALFGALIFILIQLVLIIDFAYGVVEMSLQFDKLDQETTGGTVAPGRSMNPWRGFMVIMSLLMIIGSFILLLYGWILLGELPHCHLNIIILIIYLILMFAITVFSLHPKTQERIPTVGLFQVAVIGLYATYLLWSAIIVDDPGQCTAEYVVGSTVYWITIVIGSIYAIGLVFYSTIPVIGETADRYNYSRANLFYLFATFYLAMIITNWSVIRRFGDGAEEVEISLGWLPVVFDVLSMIVLMFMFLATLIAPFLCPARFQNGYSSHTLKTDSTYSKRITEVSPDDL